MHALACLRICFTWDAIADFRVSRTIINKHGLDFILHEISKKIIIRSFYIFLILNKWDMFPNLDSLSGLVLNFNVYKIGLNGNLLQMNP